MNNPKDMLVSANVCKHPNYRPSVDLVHWYCPDCDEPFGNVMDEFAKLRSERDELVGALRRMTDRASEIGQPAVDAMDGEDFHLLADAISMSREVLAKHKPE